jgi:hypothetical protein
VTEGQASPGHAPTSVRNTSRLNTRLAAVRRFAASANAGTVILGGSRLITQVNVNTPMGRRIECKSWRERRRHTGNMSTGDAVFGDVGAFCVAFPVYATLPPSPRC